MNKIGVLVICCFLGVGLSQCKSGMSPGELALDIDDPYGGRLGPEYGYIEQPGPFSPAFGGEQENIFAREADPFDGY